MAIADRLRMATRFVDAAQYLPGSGPQGEEGISLGRRVSGPLLANLSWRSATLRHAARTALVVSAALAATLVWHGPYTHWLTITLVLVMQPFFAMTWQRSLERVGGTLLGGLVAGALSALLQTRLHVAGMLPILGALALAVRQVSYGVYIAVYTPTVIFLVESFHPGESQLHIALARAGFTILGGLIAVAANALLWPSWEPDQVREDLQTAIAAHAAYAADVLGGAADAVHARTRRAAGLASNNLEASLARAMQEPRRGEQARLQAVLVADATLRRIAGRLGAIALERKAANGVLQGWVIAALTALGNLNRRRQGRIHWRTTPPIAWSARSRCSPVRWHARARSRPTPPAARRPRYDHRFAHMAAASRLAALARRGHRSRPGRISRIPAQYGRFPPSPRRGATNLRLQRSASRRRCRC
jgi:uncharacterized membrane protein YccC